MRPALTANSGSRGKSQARCRQGRMASSWSHRHTVLALRVATRPERWASRTMSAVLRRERGRPKVAGSSHAMAFICTTTSGGENPGPARARALLETGEPFVEEPFAPEADHIASHRKRGSDVVIRLAFGGGQNHLGPENLEIWQRIFSSATLQGLLFLPREGENIEAFPRHFDPFSSEGTIAETPIFGKE